MRVKNIQAYEFGLKMGNIKLMSFCCMFRKEGFGYDIN